MAAHPVHQIDAGGWASVGDERTCVATSTGANLQPWAKFPCNNVRPATIATAAAPFEIPSRCPCSTRPIPPGRVLPRPGRVPSPDSETRSWLSTVPMSGPRTTRWCAQRVAPCCSAAPHPRRIGETRRTPCVSAGYGDRRACCLITTVTRRSSQTGRDVGTVVAPSSTEAAFNSEGVESLAVAIRRPVGGDTWIFPSSRACPSPSSPTTSGRVSCLEGSSTSTRCDYSWSACVRRSRVPAFRYASTSAASRFSTSSGIGRSCCSMGRAGLYYFAGLICVAGGATVGFRGSRRAYRAESWVSIVVPFSGLCLLLVGLALLRWADSGSAC